MQFPEKMRQAIIERTMKKFVLAKGKDYYLYLKVLDKHLGQQITDRAYDMMSEQGKTGLSFADLCHLLVQFDFPANRMKSLMSILENHKVIPSNMYRKTKHLGVRASLIELGYEKCPNPDCWRWSYGFYPCACEVKSED